MTNEHQRNPLSPDEVAAVLGATSWADLLRHADSGERLRVRSEKIGAMIPEWDELRVNAGLIQVREGMDWLIGRRSAFSQDEIAEDLAFDGWVASYDDYRMPLVCPRAANVMKTRADTPPHDLSNAPLSFVLLGLIAFPLYWVAVWSPSQELTTNLVYGAIPGVIIGGPIIAYGLWLKWKMARAPHYRK